jgi:hypothetical protein
MQFRMFIQSYNILYFELAMNFSGLKSLINAQKL